MALTCLHFDGAAVPDQYAELPLAGGDGIREIEVLVRLDALTATFVNHFWHCRTSTSLGSGSRGFGMGLRPAPDLELVGHTHTSNLFYTAATGVLALATWYRVSITWNGASTWRAYLNGVEVATTSIAGLTGFLMAFLGKAPSGGADFNGYAADFRVWGTAQSDANRLARAFTRLVGNEAGLSRYWRLDDGAGTALAATTGGVDGTVVNATWATAECPFAPGAPGAFTDPLVGDPVGPILSADWGDSDYDCDPPTYDLQLSLDGGGTWPHTLAAALAVSEWSGTICGYEPTETAVLRVRASNVAGDSAWTESAVFEINPIVSPGRMKNMRACQRQILASASYGVHVMFLAEDGAGDEYDYSEWFMRGRWVETIDQPVISATVELAYAADGESLSPLMEASLRNTDGGSGYAPGLYPGRWCALLVAVTAWGDPRPADGDAAWILMWEGRIDVVNFASEQAIVLSIRDLGAWLVDTQIEEERTYATPANPLEDLQQEILDDNPAHPSNPVPTLVVQGDPDWHIDRHVQPQTRLMQALLDLAAQIGWDLRYEWTPDDGFALRLAEPRRDVVTPDTTWGPDDEYLEVPLAEIGDDQVRNRLKALYKDAGGVLREATLNNLTSAAIFGNRWMQLGGQPIAAITTGAEADRLLEAVAADLAFPEFDHAYRFRFNPFFMLGDFYAFTQNGVHYDVDQDGGVVHIEHVLEGGGGTSTIRTSSRPRGAYKSWLQKEDPRYPPQVLTLGLTDLGGGEMEIGATFSQSVKRVEVWERMDSPPTPVDTYTKGRFKPEDFPIVLPVSNGEHHVLIHAFDDHGQIGDAEDSITTAGGGGGDDPGDTPTDIPGTPMLTRGPEVGGFQDAMAEWVNPNTIHGLDYQWMENGVEGAWNTGLPAGTDDYFEPFAVGTSVRLRLRYTAGVGQEGPPSPWSNYLALTG